VAYSKRQQRRRAECLLACLYARLENGIPYGQMVPQIWDVPSWLISVSEQTLRGLVKRGLVVNRPHDSGAGFFGLTDEGIETAKNLNINDYKKPVYTEDDWKRDHDGHELAESPPCAN